MKRSYFVTTSVGLLESYSLNLFFENALDFWSALNDAEYYSALFRYSTVTMFLFCSHSCPGADRWYMAKQ